MTSRRILTSLLVALTLVAGRLLRRRRRDYHDRGADSVEFA